MWFDGKFTMKTILVNNYKVYPFTSKDELLNFIDDKKVILVSMNALIIVKRDIQLLRIVNDHIGYCDGIGAIIALKRRGMYNAIKIPGCELWLDVIAKYHPDRSFYLIGSTEDVVNMVAKKLNSEFKNINILGVMDGFLTGKKKDKIIQDLITLKPDIVFVAQGCPKQELLMEELFDVHKALYMGLGGSFDIYAGIKKRAPKFFLNNNIEWLYRLIKEPSRIVRYLYLIKFFYLLILKKM